MADDQAKLTEHVHEASLLFCATASLGADEFDSPMLGMLMLKDLRKAEADVVRSCLRSCKPFPPKLLEAARRPPSPIAVAATRMARRPPNLECVEVAGFDTF